MIYSDKYMGTIALTKQEIEEFKTIVLGKKDPGCLRGVEDGLSLLQVMHSCQDVSRSFLTKYKIFKEAQKWASQA